MNKNFDELKFGDIFLAKRSEDNDDYNIKTCDPHEIGPFIFYKFDKDGNALGFFGTSNTSKSSNLSKMEYLELFYNAYNLSQTEKNSLFYLKYFKKVPKKNFIKYLDSLNDIKKNELSSKIDYLSKKNQNLYNYNNDKKSNLYIGDAFYFEGNKKEYLIINANPISGILIAVEYNHENGKYNVGSSIEINNNSFFPITYYAYEGITSKIYKEYIKYNNKINDILNNKIGIGSLVKYNDKKYVVLDYEDNVCYIMYEATADLRNNKTIHQINGKKYNIYFAEREKAFKNSEDLKLLDIAEEKEKHEIIKAYHSSKRKEIKYSKDSINYGTIITDRRNGDEYIAVDRIGGIYEALKYSDIINGVYKVHNLQICNVSYKNRANYSKFYQSLNKLLESQNINENDYNKICDLLDELESSYPIYRRGEIILKENEQYLIHDYANNEALSVFKENKNEKNPFAFNTGKYSFDLSKAYRIESWQYYQVLDEINKKEYFKLYKKCFHFFKKVEPLNNTKDVQLGDIYYIDNHEYVILENKNNNFIGYLVNDNENDTIDINTTKEFPNTVEFPLCYSGIGCFYKYGKYLPNLKIEEPLEVGKEFFNQFCNQQYVVIDNTGEGFICIKIDYHKNVNVFDEMFIPHNSNIPFNVSEKKLDDEYINNVRNLYYAKHALFEKNNNEDVKKLTKSTNK